jgi:hypothetical protein
MYINCIGSTTEQVNLFLRNPGGSRAIASSMSPRGLPLCDSLADEGAESRRLDQRGAHKLQQPTLVARGQIVLIWAKLIIADCEADFYLLMSRILAGREIGSTGLVDVIDFGRRNCTPLPPLP